MKNRVQYNAAIKYLENREYKIKRSNGILFIAMSLVISYFIVLYMYKIISCIK